MSRDSLSNYAAILLAAGSGTRMGGPNKLLRDLHGRPLLTHALDTLAGLGLAQIVVLTGHDHVRIEALIAPYGFDVCHNTRHNDGMGTSIAAGARAIRGTPRGVFIHLGDVPLVAPETYRALATALASDTQHRVFIPTYDDRRGHPVLFRADLLPDLMTLEGDIGARNIIARLAAQEIVVTDPFIARDVDRTEDLDALRARG